jgi:hypothetical protein
VPGPSIPLLLRRIVRLYKLAGQGVANAVSRMQLMTT